MEREAVKQAIEQGQTALGIEFGSTTIKAVLVTQDFQVVASGSYVWENELDHHIWTYPLAKVWEGVQTSYAKLAAEVKEQYGLALTKIGSIGISAMMHGYLAFDKEDNLLVPFRTWRNNITGEAAAKLTDLFGFNIPERWSIAHLYQAILNQEDHVKDLAFITTLDGYVTWQLTGEKTTGIGDASGMFPIDEATHDYDARMLDQFAALPEVAQFDWQITALLPKVLLAGETAGHLTAAGAKLLDPSGQLEPGALFAPSEGDAGTGMVATNAVRKRTGNVSIGTSAFSMVVLDQALNQVHRDIDVVTTPDGAPVAMVHTNNCSSDINAWANVFNQFARLIGVDLKPNELYEKLFDASLRGEQDAGGLVNFAYLSGENITRVQEGRPMLVRKPDSNFSLANLFKVQLYSAFAPLKIGMDILLREEHIRTDSLVAQGGLFKTPVVAQQVLADALDTPITVMSNAGQGGPWGMAVLALYAADHRGKNLADYLDQEVFVNSESATLAPEPASVKGYEQFIDNYKQAMPAEQKAGETMKLD
ncbi:xylulokinase [Lactobacillus sp. 3B(2020)]|uniref:xylulokinase n=1 Tax=Lactobacillus sp. 3B(2020) TaxID=2695882 RepID=UPI0015DE41FF|nr:FGGY-family carbohydrate kinase [Lactobacillus sp. 3B(2020)]QLL69127.1 ATPase [Lactobacillus sp. 3B(2020)]